MNDVVLNVYIIHSTVLLNRKKNVDKLIQSLYDKIKHKQGITINHEYVSKYDASDISKLSLADYVNTLPIENADNVDIEYFKRYNNQLSNQQISNALNHYSAICECSKNGKNDINLILEDDICFTDDSLDRLVNNLLVLSSDDDNFITLLGQPIQASNIIDMNTLFKTKIEIDKHNMQTINNCESYIISSEHAKILTDMFLPIRFETNIQLCYLARKKKYNMYKSCPNIFVDGSKTGAYHSSISPNNILIYNDDYKLFYNYLMNQQNVSQYESKIDEILKNNSDNADFLILYSIYLKQTNAGKDTIKAILRRAYDIYVGEHVPITNKSNLLHNYIELYKVYQI